MTIEITCFKAYDIRGQIPNQLNPDVAYRIGNATAEFLGAKRVVVGRDMRLSSAELTDSVIQGLTEAGVDVLDIGLCGTEMVYFATTHLKADGGIMVTASHNPAEWNALKFAAPEGTFLDAETFSAFLEFARHDDPVRASWDELGTVRADDGAAGQHLEAILELPQLDLPALRARGFKVALDCVRGAGATIMPQLLEALGCEVAAINMEMDGHFPRDPEPTAENLADFAEFVRGRDADIGLAVDPDVDRLSLVDESGVPLGEDLTLALASAVVLRRTRELS